MREFAVPADADGLPVFVERSIMPQRFDRIDTGPSDRFLANSTAVVLVLWAIVGFATGAGADDTEKKTEKQALSFEKNVLPIFRAKCFGCHQGAEAKAELDLSRPDDLLSGGDSGAAIRIGTAEYSLLYERITADEMPKGGPPLTAEEKGLIRTWINDGAKGVDAAAGIEDEAIGRVEHWSFLPPVRPAVPKVGALERVRNPIDAFILDKLEAQRLASAPQADRLTLLRRASFDLLGLPPTVNEVETFSADSRPDAYERLIDRLLASAHYGERWGRHWLDAAGYTDSAGILSEDRPLPLAWRYRDYVVQAFNRDKPYDRFLREQIAGDELTDYWTAYATRDSLPADVVEGVIATGFLRTAPDPSRPDFSTIKNAVSEYYYPTINDTMQIVASATMGLTLQCARCHSHKFDPIPQTDYYRLQSIFMTAYRPKKWLPQMKRRLFIASESQKKSADAHNAKVDAIVKKVRGEQSESKKTFAARLFDTRLGALPEVIRADVRQAVEAPKEKRTAVQKYLAEKFEGELRPDAKTLDKLLPETYAKYAEETKARNQAIAAQERRRMHFDEIRALYDLPGEASTPLLLRGDPRTPGPQMQPGAPRAIRTEEPFRWTPPPPDARTSGRRLALARWLTQSSHPLTARVMVNRIWMHHFGVGLVATPGDFGAAGEPPSHPELLDWLATEFVASGWSIKSMHRMIMTSSTYRQRSRIAERQRSHAESIDPENRLLWRQRIRRLEAEPFRDAVLSASGRLNRSLHGAPIPMERHPNGEVTTLTGRDGNRRSIYLQTLRLTPLTVLELFDQPAMETNCVQRSRSTVSLQALTLMNSDTMVAAAEAFAERVLAERPDDPVEHAVSLAFSRPPDEEERKLLEEFVDRQSERHAAAGKAAEARRLALADLCNMLLGANEFAYVD